MGCLDERVSIGTAVHWCMFIGHDDEEIGVLFFGHGVHKLERKGQPKQILEAINKSYDVTTEDAEALLHSIKEGEIPMRFDSDFDESVSQ